MLGKKICFCLALSFPLWAMAQDLPDSLEHKRQGTFRFVEWKDDNGKSHYISEDSAKILNQKKQALLGSGNANLNINNNAPSNKDATPQLLERIESYRYYMAWDEHIKKELLHEEKTTKTIIQVMHNGAPARKTSTQTEITSMHSVCLPQIDNDWQDFLDNLSNLVAHNARLEDLAEKWKTYIEKKNCLAPFIVEKTLNILPSVPAKEAFVKDILPIAANPLQACIQPYLSAATPTLASQSTKVTEQPKVASTVDSSVIASAPSSVENTSPMSTNTDTTLAATPALSAKEKKAAQAALKKQLKAEAKAQKAAAKNKKKLS